MTLNEWLDWKNLTPIEFAKQINVDPVTVRRYLNRTRRPDWPVIERIVRVTDGKVTANDFLDKVQMSLESRVA